MSRKRKIRKTSAVTLAARAKRIDGGAKRIEVVFTAEDQVRLSVLRASGYASTDADMIRRAVHDAARLLPHITTPAT
jgi:hypothetical protein